MGCATSKEKICKHCKDSISPVRRSYSVHHKHDKTGENNHVVALTSSTLGSLRLDSSIQNHNDIEIGKNQLLKHLFVLDDICDDKCLVEDNVVSKENGSVKEEFALGMIEAKAWSNMINEKIPKIVPKTPCRTPPGEPETINAWELMEGLEDISPLRPVQHIRSFSFQVPRNHDLFSSIDDQPTPRVKENGDDICANPLLVDSDFNTNSNSNENSIVSEFDPEVIAAFRKALEDLPPASQFHLKDCELDAKCEKNARRGVDKLIVYFTSLRGVRKTFEDCCHVRVILKGLGVKVDERDMSMHSGFKDELKELLGEGFGKGGLPRVFIGKRYIGGADEIRQLNEEGKLEKMVEGCELMDDGCGNGNGKGCEACGDIRFVPCETCSGSCKIYYEGDYDEEVVDDGSENEVGFQRCPDCNENGLKRCPVCCD